MPTILVTGASRGIGLEFVRQYAAAGWDVIAAARDPATARALDGVRRRAGGNVAVEPLDVTHPQQLEWLVGKYAETPIDVLLNNAGELGPRGAHREHLHRQFFGSLDYQAWRRVMEVNLFAPIRIAEAFAEQVERSGEKKMIFVSSTQGSIAEGTVPVFAYCSSKAALNKCVAMTALAVEPRGIIATAVCPGHVRTELGGQGATLEPADSVASLRRLIARLVPGDSGQFIRHDGTRVAW
jgi:NAD(P)-dependent dehydrogenase (short-subunit alcohol dehydrogenase family)